MESRQMCVGQVAAHRRRGGLSRKLRDGEEPRLVAFLLAAHPPGHFTGEGPLTATFQHFSRSPSRLTSKRKRDFLNVGGEGESPKVIRSVPALEALTLTLTSADRV